MNSPDNPLGPYFGGKRLQLTANRQHSGKVLALRMNIVSSFSERLYIVVEDVGVLISY